MKKIIFISLLSVLLLSSCSIDWNDEKTKTITTQNTKISKLEKEVEDYKKEKENDLFKKKQECAKYKKEIEDKIKQNNDNMNQMNYIDFYNEMLMEVFYSNSGKSCYSLSDIIQTEKLGGKKEYYSLYNILTAETTLYDKYSELSNYGIKIKELKGE